MSIVCSSCEGDMCECGMVTAAMFFCPSSLEEADFTSLLGSGAESRGSPGGAGVDDREREEIEGRVRRPLPQAPGTNRKPSMVVVLLIWSGNAEIRASGNHLLGERERGCQPKQVTGVGLEKADARTVRGSSVRRWILRKQTSRQGVARSSSADEDALCGG